MNYVQSTASQDMTYPIYTEGKQNQATIIKKIIVYGTANVANPTSLLTPQGMVTELSDEDVALLKKSAAFQRHVEKGFMKLCDKSQLDVSDMEKKDGSAQIQDKDYATASDPRVPTSGDCFATCGRGDRIKGQKGINFVDE